MSDDDLRFPRRPTGRVKAQQGKRPPRPGKGKDSRRPPPEPSGGGVTVDECREVLIASRRSWGRLVALTGSDAEVEAHAEANGSQSRRKPGLRRVGR